MLACAVINTVEPRLSEHRLTELSIVRTPNRLLN